ncbi:MAG: Rossmann-like and DUF2520 domain-containing protein [Planctomycetota bacterium]
MQGSTTLAVIGAGRMARALLRSLRPEACTVLGVHARRDDAWSRLLVEGLVGRRARQLTMPEVFGADIVFVAVSDAALPGVVEELADLDPGQGRTRMVLHASGFHGLGGLAALSNRGLGLGMIHPLRSLPEGATLSGALVLVQAVEGHRDEVLQFVAGFGGEPLWCPDLDPALYHAAATLLANGFTALFAAVLELLQKATWGRVTPAQALGLVDSAAEPLRPPLDQSPSEALTGPVRRGDAAVVRRHLDALRREAPEALPTYRALMRHCLGLARKAGLDPALADEVGRVLASGGERV